MELITFNQPDYGDYGALEVSDQDDTPALETPAHLAASNYTNIPKKIENSSIL